MADYVISIELTGDESDLDDALDNAASSAKGFESKLKGIGKAIIAAFAVDKVIEFGKSVIETTAHLDAMDAKFDQIFKGTEGIDAMARMEKISGETNTHMNRLKENFSNFGAQAKGAGMVGVEAMNQTERATRMAADAAAFYDIKMEDAAAALSSFLKGNFNAGDAIGVFTSAKAMDTRANELWGKSWKDLTESERQWLLLDTVEKMYEMNGALGQASRESGEYEKALENMKDTWDELKRTMGEPFLPTVIAGMQGLTSTMQDLDGFIKNFTTNWEGIKSSLEGTTLGNIIAEFEELGSIFDGLKQTFADFGDTGNFDQLVTGVTSAIDGFFSTVTEMIPLFSDLGAEMLGELGRGIVNSYPDLISGFGEIVVALMQGMNNLRMELIPAMFEFSGNTMKSLAEGFIAHGPAVAESIITTMKDIILQLIENWSEHFEMMRVLGGNMISAISEGIIEYGPDVLIAIGQIGLMILEALAEIGIALLESGIEWMMNLGQGMLEGFDGAIIIISELINGVLEAVGTAAINFVVAGIEWMAGLVTGIATGAGNVLTSVNTTAQNAGQAVHQAVVNFISGGLQWMIGVANGVLSGAGQVISSVTTTGSQAIASVLSFVGQFLSGGLQWVSSIARGIMSGVGQVLSSARSVGTGAVGAVRGFIGQMVSVGGDLIRGVARGVSGAAGVVVGAVRSAISSAVGAAKRALGIASPSRIMRDEVGRWIPEGVAVGIEMRANSITREMKHLDDLVAMDTGNINQSINQDLNRNITNNDDSMRTDRLVTVNIYDNEFTGEDNADDLYQEFVKRFEREVVFG